MNLLFPNSLHFHDNKGHAEEVIKQHSTRDRKSMLSSLGTFRGPAMSRPPTVRAPPPLLEREMSSQGIGNRAQ